MLETVGASALKDIMGMLKESSDFFTKDAAGRQAILDQKLPSYPQAFAAYLGEVKEEAFVADLKTFFHVLDGFSVDQPSGLLKTLMVYMSHDLGMMLDRLDVDFFFLSYQARQEKLSELFPDTSFLNQALQDLFMRSTYQELAEMAYRAINEIQDIPTIVVQSPLELSSAQRQEMRKTFLDKHPNSFVEFQTNSLLIGGMRVFVEGVVVDHSWLGKVQAIASLEL